MTEYSELVKALRCKRDDCEGCDTSFFDKDEGWMCQYAAKDDDAAAAIEELQETLEAVQKNSGINFRMWEEAQAEVKRLQEKLGEVVRCWECKYHLQETERTNPYCNRFHCMKPDDWYCADGEREVQDGR